MSGRWLPPCVSSKRLEAMKDMLILDENKLEPGDIILTRAKKGLLSNLIRWFTHGAFSHVAIFVGDSNIIDATRRGVCDNTIMRHPFKKANLFCILRHPNLTPQQQQKLEQILRSQYISAEYNAKGILRFVFSFIPVGRYKTLFCSELAAECYSKIGVTIQSKSNRGVTPKDFEDSPLFIQVHDCYYAVKNKQFRKITKNEAPCAKKQQDTVRKLMKKMRHLYAKYNIAISTIEDGFDLCKYVLEDRINFLQAEVISIAIVGLISKTGYDSSYEDSVIVNYLGFKHPKMIISSLRKRGNVTDKSLEKLLTQYANPLQRHIFNSKGYLQRYHATRLQHYLCLYVMYRKVIMYNRWAINNIQAARKLLSDEKLSQNESGPPPRKQAPP